MQFQECLAEASREGRGGLGDAALGAGQLCGKARTGSSTGSAAGVRMETGGRTPNASADKKITFLAAGAEEIGRTMF